VSSGDIKEVASLSVTDLSVDSIVEDQVASARLLDGEGCGEDGNCIQPVVVKLTKSNAEKKW
jgi:hypothetical protein